MTEHRPVSILSMDLAHLMIRDDALHAIAAPAATPGEPK
jgi:hypothetical protein